MSSDEQPDDRAKREDGEAGEATAEAVWTPPEISDQAPGEETVQVNDPYTGGGRPPEDESHSDDEQHPTGG